MNLLGEQPHSPVPPARSSGRVGQLSAGLREGWRKEHVPHRGACRIALYELYGALNEPSDGSALYQVCKTSETEPGQVFSV